MILTSFHTWCVILPVSAYLLQQGSCLSALVDVAPVQRARVVSGLTKRFMELELHDVGDEVSEIKKAVSHLCLAARLNLLA